MIPFIHIGPLTIGTFGLMMWFAFVAGFLALRADLERRGLNADPHTMVGVLAIAGLAGAKLYNALENPNSLMASPFSTIFSRTGFAWYGGFIAGTLCFIYFSRKYKVPLLTLMDAAAPATALGYAVGRIGCLLSGDGDYGRPTNLPWAMSFPNGLVPTTEKVHPTPIYELMIGVCIFYYLWRLGAKAAREPLPHGRVVAELFIWMGTARFLVEFIRINPAVLFGLSNAQILSLVAVAGGMVLLVTVNKRFNAGDPEHVFTRS
jgi:phosphatidylglycerol---prolipoprotein diacylglyceryl transferase